MRRIIVVGLLVVAAGTVLGACGGGDDSSGSSTTGMNTGSKGTTMGQMGENRPVVAGAREIAVKGEALAFEPKKLEIGAGEDVTIVFTAVDLGHDITVEKIGHVVYADMGKTERGGLRIDEPGTYRFWCSVPGHRAGGMTGTIVVT